MGPVQRPGDVPPGSGSAGNDTGRRLPERPPYLKFAFSNPYNLSLFLGTLAAAGITFNPVLALVAVGAEALWLLHAPDSKLLRRILWDPKFEKLRLSLEEQEHTARMAELPPGERRRVQELVQKQQMIDQLAAQNPSFTGDLLRTELQKTRRLVDSFLEMALTCSRYESYLHAVNLDALEKDRQRWTMRAQANRATDQERDISKKNLAVIMKRMDKLKEIRNYLDVARSQLDLIDNSFQLIADQIVTMQSPTELSGQLDDLLDGVESIRQTAVDTEKIMSTLEA